LKLETRTCVAEVSMIDEDGNIREDGRKGIKNKQEKLAFFRQTFQRYFLSATSKTIRLGKLLWQRKRIFFELILKLIRPRKTNLCNSAFANFLTMKQSTSLTVDNKLISGVKMKSWAGEALETVNCFACKLTVVIRAC
jgi:hypothetical protein